MKISERTLKRVGEIITGDKGLSPYRSGPQLCHFFNELGTNHVYGSGFPTRWVFAEDCIRAFNGKTELKKVILSSIDPRDYLSATIYDQTTNTHRPVDIGVSIAYLNEFLSFDGYEIVPHGKSYDIIDKSRGEILVDIQLELSHLSHAFITEQIDKCRSKISGGDYDGAITNSRSLVEAVLSSIEGELDVQAPEYDGDLPKLYKRVQKLLSLVPDNPNIGDSLKETLRGFISIVGGLSGISNKMGDRHVRKHKPSKHHAVLAVNSAMTFCNFIFDTYAFQNLKNR